MSENSLQYNIYSNSDSDDFIPPTSIDTSSDESAMDERYKWKKGKKTPCRKKLRLPSLCEYSIPGPSNMNADCVTPADESNIATNSFNTDADKNVVQERGTAGIETNANNEPPQNTPKKKIVRKIVAKPASWKCNMRKKAHQDGKAYVTRRGKSVPEKTVKNTKNCQSLCKYKCSQKITHGERLEVHKSYYSLQSATEKRHFIIHTTERSLTARPQKKNVEQDDPDEESNNDTQKYTSRRQFSLRYFFHVKGEKIQVCKKFYLDTLHISQKPVYTAHKYKNIETNTPTPDQRGKSQGSRRTPEGDTDFAREHIKSFPTIESHYCRANTKKSYLGSHLNISKMYDLYKEKCGEENVKPVKESLYYKIFITEFNLDFHIPKSDRCDMCEKYKVAEKTNTLTEELKVKYNRHQTLKNAMRAERKKDKENDTPVLLFDLQNVIMCPHANISSFFYLRKLNVYNLTAYYAITKQVYCAIWPEMMAGRSGNDIASAMSRILDVLIQENDITELITWSDSCVPQNRNSIMSNAILHFLRENENISSVTMKYSVPGHSCIQEVDNAHSNIEKSMNRTDFYSPIGLIRLLKQVNRRNPYRIIQMRAEDFKDFSATAKMLNYKTVPFSHVASLKFTKTHHEIKYKLTHEIDEQEKVANIKFIETQRRSSEANPTGSVSALNIKPKIQKKKIELSDLKKKDIKSAIPFMPLQDRSYYSAVKIV